MLPIISIDDYNKQNIELARLFAGTGLRVIFFIDLKTDQAVEQARELHAMGYELGGHTISHPMDMKCLDDDALAHEVNLCWNILTEITGKPIEWFAYPRGRHDQRVRDAVEKAGFKYARTTIVNHVGPNHYPMQTHTAVHAFQRKEYDGYPWWVVANNLLNRDGEVFHFWMHAKEIWQGDNLDRLKAFIPTLQLHQRAYENLDRK